IQWQSGSYRRFVERLGAGGRGVRDDKRGTGVLGPGGCAPALGQRGGGLRVVLDAGEGARAAVVGFFVGGPTAVRLPGCEPGRTAALILSGTSAGPPPLWYRNRFRELIARWGEGASLDMFAPSLAASDAQRESAGAFERAGASPAMARALLEALVETDVRT